MVQELIVVILANRTKTIGVLSNVDGEQIHQSTEQSVDFTIRLPYQVGAVLSTIQDAFVQATSMKTGEFGLALRAVVVSYTGAPSVKLAQLLREQLDDNGWTTNSRIRIVSETESALAAMCSPPTRIPGIAIASGIGCTALVRGLDRKTHFEGGMIPTVDDRGGGYDVGRTVLEYVIDGILHKRTLSDNMQSYLLRDVRGPRIIDLVEWARLLSADRRRLLISGLAAEVNQAAIQGDEDAQQILEQVVQRIIVKVEKCVNEVGIDNLPRPIPVALVGGLLRHSTYTKRCLLESLESRFGSVDDRTVEGHVIRGNIELGRDMLSNL